MPVINPKVAIPALLSLALLGCSRQGELTSLGIITSRSACPDVAIPAATGDITRERKPGDADAALDPMADPEVRAAVQRASFELLVGFQLTQDQLRYNATR